LHGDRENKKAVKAHNAQKVLQQGYLKILPVSVVLVLVSFMYLLNFFVVIVFVLNDFLLQARPTTAFCPSRLGWWLPTMAKPATS
jgi:hypothetical protein